MEEEVFWYVLFHAWDYGNVFHFMAKIFRIRSGVGEVDPESYDMMFNDIKKLKKPRGYYYAAIGEQIIGLYSHLPTVVDYIREVGVPDFYKPVHLVGFPSWGGRVYLITIIHKSIYPRKITLTDLVEKFGR